MSKVGELEKSLNWLGSILKGEKVESLIDTEGVTLAIDVLGDVLEV